MLYLTINQYQELGSEARTEYLTEVSNALQTSENPVNVNIDALRAFAITLLDNKDSKLNSIGLKFCIEYIRNHSCNYLIDSYKVFVENYSILTIFSSYDSKKVVIESEDLNYYMSDLALLDSGYNEDTTPLYADLETQLQFLAESECIRTKTILDNLGIRALLPEDLPEAAAEYSPLIPENVVSGDSLNESTSRFRGAQWFEKIQNKEITIAGLGGIGSWTTLLVSRLRPKVINLFDNDVVEESNMSGQLYSKENINDSKVDASYDNTVNFSDYSSVNLYKQFVDSTTILPSKIMICGFDSMRSRKEGFKKWYNTIKIYSEENKKECLFIDGRLTLDSFQVFCLVGNDEYNIERYIKEFLFDDSEVEETQCSLKQTSFTACMIASVICNLLVNFTINLEVPDMADLPFLTSYNSTLMRLKTEN